MFAINRPTKKNALNKAVVNGLEPWEAPDALLVASMPLTFTNRPRIVELTAKKLGLTISVQFLAVANKVIK